MTLRAVNVSFDSSYNQNYGYDDEEEDETEYVSVSRDGTTELKVMFNPFSPDKYWLNNVDDTKFTITSGTDCNSDHTYIEIAGASTADKDLGLLQVKHQGDVLKRITVGIYKEVEKKVALFTFSDADAPKIPNTKQFQENANKILKQCVVKGIIAEYLQVDEYYDHNDNGFFDYYYYSDGSNPELNTITTNCYSDEYLPAVYTRKIKRNWRLADSVSKGENTIVLESVENIRRGQWIKFKLSLPDLPEHEYEPKRVAEIIESQNKVVLQSKMFFNYAAGHDIYYDNILGLYDPQTEYLFFSAGVEVFAHELLHSLGLADVVEKDNIMCSTNSDGTKIRYRLVTPAYYGMSENQWETIRRD